VAGTTSSGAGLALCWAGGEKGASLPLHSSELDKLLAEMNLEPTWATKIKDLHQQMIFEMSAEMWSKNKNSWFSFYSDYPLSAWVEFVLNSFSFLPSHLGLGDKKSSLELKTRFIETILSFEKSPENIQIWHGVLVPYLLEEHQDESLRQLVLDISKKQKTIKTYFGAELGTSQIIRYLDNKKIIDDKVKRIQTIQDYQSLFHKKIDRSTSSDPSLYYQEDEYYTLIPIFPSGAIRMAGEPSPSYMWDPVLDYLNRERSLLFLKGLELLSKKSEPAMIKKVFDPMMDFRLGEMPHKKELDYQTLKKIALFINKDESSSPYLVNDKEQLVKLSDGNYLLEYLVLENQWVIVENYRSGHETGFIIIDISKADYKILHKFIMLYASRD
jgi:hypothetical protein